MVGTKTKIGGASAAFMLIASVFYSLIIINPDITVTVGQPGIFNFTTTDRGTLYIYGMEDTEFGVEVEFVKIIKWDGKERQPSRILTEAKVLSDGTVLPPGTHVFPNWGYRDKVWNNNKFIYIPLKSGKHHFRFVFGTQKSGYLILDAYNEAHVKEVWPPYTYENGVFTEGNKATWGEAAFQRYSDGVWLKEKDLNISNGNWTYFAGEFWDYEEGEYVYRIYFDADSYITIPKGRADTTYDFKKMEIKELITLNSKPASDVYSISIKMSGINITIDGDTFNLFDNETGVHLASSAPIWIKGVNKTAINESDPQYYLTTYPTVLFEEKKGKFSFNIYFDNDWANLIEDSPIWIDPTWKINSSGADSTWGAGIHDNSTEDKGSATLVRPAIFADDFDDGDEDLTEQCGTGSVVNGRYKFTGSFGLVCPAYYNFNVTDAIVVADVNTTVADPYDGVGLLIRYNATLKSSYATISDTGDGGSRIVQKNWTNNEWTFSTLAINISQDIVLNEDYGVVLRANSTEIYHKKVNASVTYELTTSDSDIAGGSIGYYLGKASEGYFDNFRALALYSTGMPILTTSYQTANRDSGTGNEPKNVTVIFTRKDFQEDLYINGVLIQADISNNTNYAIGAGNGTNYSITINGTAQNSTAYNRVQSITVWEGSSVVGDTTPPTVTIVSPANTTITDNTPDLNITIDETVNVTYSWNGEGNISGCRLCTTYNTTYGENNGSDTDLVAMWHFNENYGAIAYDDTANGNDGTLGNVTAGTKPTWTTGKFGYGLNFDGANDFVNISYDASLDVLDGNTPFALTMWIKFNVIPSTAGTAYMIFAQNYGTGTGKNWLQVLEGTDKIGSPIGPEAYHLSDFVVQNNTWYFLVLGYDGTNLTIWVNGNLELDEASTPDEDATGDYYIGTKRTADDSWFNGTIDEVMLYNRSLSAGEISELYNRTLPEGLHNVTVYANDTAGNSNSTKRWFTISTGAIDSKVYVYNGTAYEENDIFYNIYCSFGESCCAPENQSASKSFIEVENNGTANGAGIRCKVNETVGAIDFLFGNSSACGDSYNVTTSWTTIWSETINQGTNRSIWIWGTWGRPAAWPDVEYICEVE